MTQPKIEGVGHGVPRMLYASDGSNWYAVLVDSDGHGKIDVVGFNPVPTSPVRSDGGDATVVTATWKEVVSYTVTAGTTFYLTNIAALDRTGAAGIEFLWRLKVAGTVVYRGRCAAGHSLLMGIITPIKATSAQAVSIELLQWSAGDKIMTGMILGFEV